MVKNIDRFNLEGDEDLTIGLDGISSKQGFAKSIEGFYNAMKALKYNNSKITIDIDPNEEGIKSGLKDYFELTKVEGSNPPKHYKGSKTKGCTLSQPLDETGLLFINCMYPDAKSLEITKCNLASAIKLIDEYKDKGCVLKFSDEVKAKIEKSPDSPEKAKFLEYCNSINIEDSKRTRFGAP